MGLLGSAVRRLTAANAQNAAVSRWAVDGFGRPQAPKSIGPHDRAAVPEGNLAMAGRPDKPGAEHMLWQTPQQETLEQESKLQTEVLACAACENCPPGPRRPTHAHGAGDQAGHEVGQPLKGLTREQKLRCCGACAAQETAQNPKYRTTPPTTRIRGGRRKVRHSCPKYAPTTGSCGEICQKFCPKQVPC